MEHEILLYTLYLWYTDIVIPVTLQFIVPSPIIQKTLQCSQHSAVLLQFYRIQDESTEEQTQTENRLLHQPVPGVSGVNDHLRLPHLLQIKHNRWQTSVLVCVTIILRILRNVSIDHQRSTSNLPSPDVVSINCAINILPAKTAQMSLIVSVDFPLIIWSSVPQKNHKQLHSSIMIYEKWKHKLIVAFLFHGKQTCFRDFNLKSLL